jgi:excisionase family DNA binding protein
MSYVQPNGRMFYGCDEAAFVSGISQRQIFRAIKSGELRATWSAGRWRIHAEDLECYGRGEAPPPRPNKLRTVTA